MASQHEPQSPEVSIEKVELEPIWANEEHEIECGRQQPKKWEYYSEKNIIAEEEPHEEGLHGLAHKIDAHEVPVEWLQYYGLHGFGIGDWTAL